MLYDLTHVEFKNKTNEHGGDEERKTKKQPLNYSEQTDDTRGDVGGVMG